MDVNRAAISEVDAAELRSSPVRRTIMRPLGAKTTYPKGSAPRRSRRSPVSCATKYAAFNLQGPTGSNIGSALFDGPHVCADELGQPWYSAPKSVPRLRKRQLSLDRNGSQVAHTSKTQWQSCAGLSSNRWALGSQRMPITALLARPFRRLVR